MKRKRKWKLCLVLNYVRLYVVIIPSKTCNRGCANFYVTCNNLVAMHGVTSPSEPGPSFVPVNYFSLGFYPSSESFALLLLLSVGALLPLPLLDIACKTWIGASSCLRNILYRAFGDEAAQPPSEVVPTIPAEPHNALRFAYKPSQRSPAMLSGRHISHRSPWHSSLFRGTIYHGTSKNTLRKYQRRSSRPDLSTLQYRLHTFSSLCRHHRIFSSRSERSALTGT